MTLLENKRLEMIEASFKTLTCFPHDFQLSQIKKISVCAIMKNLEANEILALEGMKLDKIFFVLDGVLRAEKKTEMNLTSCFPIGHSSWEVRNEF
jgi:hypothetical protein